MHNKIAKIALNHFNSLPKSGKPTANQWTVLSCILLQVLDDFQVVALGTGSKCIGRSLYSPDGDILNDSHAEIVCRRAFLRYLYSQIRSYSDIFQNSNCELKANVKFHFFTTHAPCGDASIFPKTESDDYGAVIDEEYVPAEKRVKVESKDIFRTGAKCLENDVVQDLRQPGDGYHVLGAVRTKPGRGDPTSSVSCSDKIAKWCQLGVQGSLLGLLLDKPVYLDSFTIAGGTPFCKNALRRALYERVGGKGEGEMAIGQSDETFPFSKGENKVPCPNSIIWWRNPKEKCSQVSVNGKRLGVTKKEMKTPSARLLICKRELFNCFQRTCKKTECRGLTYKETKRLNTTYQEGWNVLKGKFKVWTTKPSNLLDFCSDIG